MYGILIAIALLGACELECPTPDHPNTAIVTCPVPKECPHKNGEARAVVYDYTNKPADGSKPVTKHLLKSVSPCGCTVKCEVCKCIPNSLPGKEGDPLGPGGKPLKPYIGKCEASYTTPEAEAKKEYDASICTYEIEVDPKCVKP